MNPNGVLAGASKSPPEKKFWPRELLLGLLPLLLGVEILVWALYVPIGFSGYADFRTLYASGYMVRTHQALYIHDPERLLKVKEQVAPLGLAFNQPMDHPAYEALFFAPLSLMPYRAAFVVFILFNLAMVALCVRVLKPSFEVLSNRWALFPVLLFAASFPISRAIVQGQDSVMLLALLAGAFVCTRRNKDLQAGLLVGIGFFKLQIVLPIALLYLLWKRWRFVFGFAVTSGTAVIATTLLIGLHGLWQYGSILLGMSLRPMSEAEAELVYSLSPLTMLNLRGLMSALLLGRVSHWTLQASVVIASAAVLFVAARRRPSMPLAIITAALVSYHLNAQDASILMIPIGLCLCSDSVWTALAAVAALIVPIAAIVPLLGYLGAVPILALFYVCFFTDYASHEVDGVFPNPYAF